MPRAANLRGAQTLVYDEENRLSALWGGGADVSYGYAEGGARLWKYDWNTDRTTVYVGSLYEERAGQRLCHVYAGGRRIATFEPQSTVCQALGLPLPLFIGNAAVVVALAGVLDLAVPAAVVACWVIWGLVVNVGLAARAWLALTDGLRHEAEPAARRNSAPRLPQRDGDRLEQAELEQLAALDAGGVAAAERGGARTDGRAPAAVKRRADAGADGRVARGVAGADAGSTRWRCP